MAIQKFTLEALQKVRKVIQAGLAVNDTLADRIAASEPNADIPEPESLDELSSIFSFDGSLETERADLTSQKQWLVSTVNPASVLLKLPGLWLKPSYRLVGYLYRAAPEGAGLIFALPETLSTTAHLQKALASSTIASPPQPEGAMPSFMTAIDGDRSAASFMVASLLRRELQEFGAMGKRQTWSHHRLIHALPTQPWQWRSEIPKDWLPKAIVMPDGQAAVEFFSCQIGRQDVVLYRHLDRYPAIGYQATSLDKAIAVVRRG